VALAEDGRRFSYLLTEGEATLPWFADTQVWIGDAVEGFTSRLSNEPEGISDQTVSGDGSVVIAATRTGRLLLIDTATGAVTQVLASPGPEGLFVPAVPGSYNEVVGSFPNGSPEVLIENVPAVVLGPSPRGYAIQIPWDTPGVSPEVPGALYPNIMLRGSEPAWERYLFGTVQNLFPRVLPVGPTGPDPPSGTLGAYSDVDSFAYAIHEDWSGPVNGDSPARPGEIIHFFGSGWGPVDGTVQTGQPTPSDRPYHIALQCDWRATGASRDVSTGTSFDVLFAGLAPGLIGKYQLDLRIPPDWGAPVFDAFCLWSSGSNTFSAETAEINVQP
jgi:uncharacterized protein (TIGR03437 family)